MHGFGCNRFAILNLGEAVSYTDPVHVNRSTRYGPKLCCRTAVPIEGDASMWIVSCNRKTFSSTILRIAKRIRYSRTWTKWPVKHLLLDKQRIMRATQRKDNSSYKVQHAKHIELF